MKHFVYPTNYKYKGNKQPIDFGILTRRATLYVTVVFEPTRCFYPLWCFHAQRPQIRQ